MAGRAPSAPRCAAIVGPYSSGKTSLLESLLHVTGVLSKKGSAKDKTLLGDSSQEARARGLSVEVTAAQAEYLGERWTFLDCPGAVELGQDMRNAVLAADVAIVVAEPQTEKALTLAPIFKFLDDNKIPHILFVNKMDNSGLRVRDVMEALQAVSSRPLVLRQVPIREEGKNGDVVAGYVDLVSERAYRYHPGQPSDLVKLPDDMLPREQEAREQMLEHLADFDDQLLEQLLSDAVPSKEAIYQQLCKDLAQDLIVPVLMGAAEQDYGVRRLLKALRHDVPGPEAACDRLGLNGEATAAVVFKTYHQPHSGKVALARVLAGQIADGQTIGGQRIGALLRPKGNGFDKIANAGIGEVVGLGRMDAIKTGDVLTASGKAPETFKWPEPLTPLYALARVLAGQIADGQTIGGQRIGALLRPKGNGFDKIANAGIGEVVGLGRMDAIKTGDVLTASGKAPETFKWPEPLTPLYALAVDVENRNDEVKLTAALAKLAEEDPSLRFGHDPDTHELLLQGQGDVHLQIALERLKLRYNLPVKARRPQVSYKETIRANTKQHARFKRQSGGHGQFGDVHVEVWPLDRGQGFEFQDRVVGGAVPRQFIGSVEEGVREYLNRGPLGFPVVDVAVALYDGQYHSVDSSDQAFKTAARMAMQEAMPKCHPILLEPIYAVDIAAPASLTSRIHSLVTSRRGQILQIRNKADWDGWEVVECLMPQSELQDLVIELRSLTYGVGNFAYRFDHLQELTGRLADKVIEQRQTGAAR